VRQPVEIATRSGEQTEALGARLAQAVPSLADAAATVHLQGNLGSGKTTFARGMLHAFGVRGTVRSPTYTLLERYETRELVVVHLDLYRVRDPAELEHLGLRELHRPEHLWVIEWPERAGGRLPDPDVCVELEAGADQHRIRLTARSPLGALWLERMPGS
jgi:tRNA threonylcarbamoyladenosine biosynthesis protein TsaE